MHANARTLIIAEAGVNHNGSLDQAKRLVDVAVAAGADVVKFQTFNPSSLVTRSATTAAYQAAGGYTSQRTMLESLCLDEATVEQLHAHCGAAGIQFLSTAFDLESVEVLRKLGQRAWKIPSGEITNVPLVEAIGAIADEVIVSTGMATVEEISAVLDWLAAAGTTRDTVTVLHCNTEYPTPYGDVNLRAMRALGEQFGVAVGYSDHTLGIEIPIAAVTLGATVIEKHFTTDRGLSGPDHKASLEPAELTAMVASIRNVERALGEARKFVTASEWHNRAVARKGIYAAGPIVVGEPFTATNLTTKRPEGTIPASAWHKVIGQAATRRYEEDDPIQW